VAAKPQTQWIGKTGSLCLASVDGEIYGMVEEIFKTHGVYFYRVRVDKTLIYDVACSEVAYFAWVPETPAKLLRIK